MRDLDLDYQSSFASQELHGSSGDDSVTLFHSESLTALEHRVISSLPAKIVSFTHGSSVAADLFNVRPEILTGF